MAHIFFFILIDSSSYLLYNFPIELELVNFPTNPSIFLVLIPQFFYNLFFEKSIANSIYYDRI